jgi:hypothetical protein
VARELRTLWEGELTASESGTLMGVAHFEASNDNSAPAGDVVEIKRQCPTSTLAGYANGRRT